MEQINSIKEKLILAKKKDQKKTIFGAKSHKYKLKNPLTLDEVALFEKEYNLTLPQGYKKMITQSQISIKSIQLSITFRNNLNLKLFLSSN